MDLLFISRRLTDELQVLQVQVQLPVSGIIGQRGRNSAAVAHVHGCRFDRVESAHSASRWAAGSSAGSNTSGTIRSERRTAEEHGYGIFNPYDRGQENSWKSCENKKDFQFSRPGSGYRFWICYCFSSSSFSSPPSLLLFSRSFFHPLNDFDWIHVSGHLSDCSSHTHKNIKMLLYVMRGHFFIPIIYFGGYHGSLGHISQEYKVGIRYIKGFNQHKMAPIHILLILYTTIYSIMQNVTKRSWNWIMWESGLNRREHVWNI